MMVPPYDTGEKRRSRILKILLLYCVLGEVCKEKGCIY